jgi:hypothetical protein
MRTAALTKCPNLISRSILALNSVESLRKDPDSILVAPVRRGFFKLNEVLRTARAIAALAIPQADEGNLLIGLGSRRRSGAMLLTSLAVEGLILDAFPQTDLGSSERALCRLRN